MLFVFPLSCGHQHIGGKPIEIVIPSQPQQVVWLTKQPLVDRQTLFDMFDVFCPIEEKEKQMSYTPEWCQFTLVSGDVSTELTDESL